MILKTGNKQECLAIVTGSSGFLGRYLIYALLERGAHVIGVDKNPGLSEMQDVFVKSPLFSFYSADFSCGNYEDLSRAVLAYEGNKIFFHIAGMAHAGKCQNKPLEAFKANVELVEHALEFCRTNNIKKFVFPSTGIVYKDKLKRPAREDDPVYADSIYAATKLSAEALVHGYANSFGLTCITARLSNVYGPASDTDTVFGTIMNQIRRDEEIKLRDLTPVRDFIFVDDVAEGLLRLADTVSEPGACVVNLSTGIGKSIRELAETTCQAVSLPLERIYNISSIDGNVSSLILDNHKLKKITGWAPSFSLTDGIAAIFKDKGLTKS